MAIVAVFTILLKYCPTLAYSYVEIFITTNFNDVDLLNLVKKLILLTKFSNQDKTLLKVSIDN